MINLNDEYILIIGRNGINAYIFIIEKINSFFLKIIILLVNKENKPLRSNLTLDDSFIKEKNLFKFF